MSEIMNDAQRQLAEDNMKLVHHTLNKYYYSIRFDEDVIQIATLALCNAAMTWQEGKSTFSTYACKCICNAVNNELRLRRQRSNVITNSLDAPICEDKTLGDLLPCEEDETRTIDYSFLELFNQDELYIYDLRTKGYSVDEIQQITRYNRRKVLRIMRTARAKYRKVNYAK